MKKINVIYLLIAVTITAAVISSCSKNDNNKSSGSGNTEMYSASGKGDKFMVNSSESKLEWTAYKVTGQHYGTVDINKGELFFDKEELTGGSFDIDFKTIKVVDITDAEMNAKLTNHLKSDDFFSASAFPAGKFLIKSVSKNNGSASGNYNINGSLTIKGITRDISFPATVTAANGMVTASSDIKIDRTLWDIKFRSGKFYENLGDKLINDEFNIKFNISAKKI